MDHQFQPSLMENDIYNLPQFHHSQLQFPMQTQLASQAPRAGWQQPNIILPKRHLPIVQTLPSTPVMSRPSTAGSGFGPHAGTPKQDTKISIAKGGPSNMSYFPMTPPLSGEPGSPNSIGSNPMISGFEADEILAGIIDSPETPNYFQHSFPLSQPTSTPTTPGLTNASSPSLQDTISCDPRALTVGADAAPTLAPSFSDNSFDDAFGTAQITTPSDPTTSTFDNCVPEGLHELDFGSDSGCDDFLYRPCSDSVNANNKRTRATSEEPTPLKKVKVNSMSEPVSPADSTHPAPSKEEPTSPMPLPETPVAPNDPESAAGQPTLADSVAKLTTDATKQEEAGSPASADGSAAAVIPGPPPQNRRGRKQSFSNDPSKQFVCDVCHRRFRRQEHLKRHHRSLHTVHKPYSCDECGKSFSRSDNLSQHQRTHGTGTIALDVVPHPHSHYHPGMPVQYHPSTMLFHVTSTMPGSLEQEHLQSPINHDSHLAFAHTQGQMQ